MYRLLSNLWTNTISWQNGNRVCSQISSSLPRKKALLSAICGTRWKALFPCPIHCTLCCSVSQDCQVSPGMFEGGVFISTVDILWLSYCSSNQYVLMGFS